MKKYLVLLCMMALQSQAFAQPPDFVKLRGRQFFDGYGQPFYPLMMNYEMDYHYINTNDYWITRDYEYGTDHDDYEDATAQQGLDEISADLDIIVNMKFNMVRPVFTPEWDATTQMFCIPARQPTGSGIYTDYKICFLPGDAACNRYLDDLEAFVNLAGTKGLYVMINGVLGDITDPNAKTPYMNYLQALGTRFANNHYVAFYDILNEPLYKYKYANDYNYWEGFSKEQACVLVKDYYDHFKYYDPGHLISGGNLAQEDVLMFDLSILKLDFSQPHIYSEIYTSHDNYDFTNRLNRVLSNAYWVSKNCAMPWVNGETGIPTSDIYYVPNPPSEPFVAGNDNHQNIYATEMLNMTRNLSGSGLFWWNFQEGGWPGAPVWGYGIIKQNADVTNLNPSDVKPTYGTFEHYLDLNHQPPPIVTVAQLPPPNYLDPYTFDLMNLNPTHSGAVSSTLTDQNNEPIANAFIRGLNYLSTNNQPPFNIVTDWIYTFSGDNGEFNLIPYNSAILGDDRTLFISGSATGSEKFTYNGNGNQVTIPTSITLQRVEFNYDATFDELVPTGKVKNFKAWNSISINSEILGKSTIRARNEIHLTDGFHAFTNSEVHIFSDQTFGECDDYHDFGVVKKLQNSKPETNSNFNKNIELSFYSAIRNVFDLSLKPNPTSDYTTLSLSNIEVAQLKTIYLRDHLGRIVYTKEFKNNELTLNLNECIPGIYTVEIISQEQKIVKKIVII